MTDKFRVSRLTPEELMQWAVRHHQPEAVLYASAWIADMADSGKEIAELREQLRAFTASDRIKTENIEMLESALRGVRDEMKQFLG